MLIEEVRTGMTTTAHGRSRRVDPRVVRTREALTTALGELIDQTPPGRTITMSAVAARAGMSRQVLHTHFPSIGDLTVATIFARLLGQDAHGTDGTDPMDTLVDALTDRVKDSGIEGLLRTLWDDADFYRKASSRHDTDRIQEVLAPTLATWLRNGTTLDGAALDVDAAWAEDAAQFTIGGMLHLMDTWLGKEDPPSVHEQAERLITFARSAARAAGDQHHSASRSS